MASSKLVKSAAAFALMATAGGVPTLAVASPPSGITITNFVTGNLDAADHFNSDRIKFQTKGPTDVRMQQIIFAPGGATGWHRHPGVVLVGVQSGTITLWDTSCGKVNLGPGSVFVDAFDHGHQATSEGGATIQVTYIAPDASPPVFRTEEPVPLCAQAF
jgi:quercetin dioxygenase-like cupin family protein